MEGENIRNIDLSYIPKRGKLIDWKNTVGLKFEFEYDDIKGVIEIIDYNKPNLTVKYGNALHKINFYSFVKCRLEKVLGKYRIDYKFDIDDVIKTKSENIRIIEKTKHHGKRAYKYKCENCGNEDILDEYNIIKRSGCNICCTATRKTIDGINDIHTMNRDFGKLLWNYADGLICTIGNDKKLDFKCSYCGSKIKNKRVNKMYSNFLKFGKLMCVNCNDGISYPEKIMYNVLKLSGVEFQTQKSFEWSYGKLYDFYLPTLNCLIETHGKQHYEKSYGVFKNLIEQQKNDKLKETLAGLNNIKLIVIDCKVSELNYIKNNILLSELSEILDLNAIDWLIVGQNSNGSLVEIACKHWNEGVRNTKAISELMKLSRPTVTTYLKKGSKIGLCNYDAKVESAKTFKNQDKSKSVVMCSINGEHIRFYNRIKDASEEMNITSSDIVRVCRGKRKSAGGFKWMYKEDYIKLKDSEIC